LPFDATVEALVDLVAGKPTLARNLSEQLRAEGAWMEATPWSFSGLRVNRD
jgi:hypothetical protein